MVRYPTLEKVVKYFRIVCQKVSDVVLHIFFSFYPEILRSLEDIEV